LCVCVCVHTHSSCVCVCVYGGVKCVEKKRSRSAFLSHSVTSHLGSGTNLRFSVRPLPAFPVAKAKGSGTSLRLQDAQEASHKHTNMRSKQHAKSCKREMHKPVHRGNLPVHAEQGFCFDAEPRANLRNLRKHFREQDKPSNLSKTLNPFQFTFFSFLSSTNV